MTTKYERVRDYKEIFKMFDRDEDGTISHEEVEGLLKSLGRNPTEEEILKLISETDQNGDGVIQVEEFIKFMETNYVMPEEKIEDIVSAFKVFDLDNNGWISLEEFKNILMKFGGEFTEKEVEQIFNESDLNKDGQLAYAEFIDMWKFQ